MELLNPLIAVSKDTSTLQAWYSLRGSYGKIEQENSAARQDAEPADLALSGLSGQFSFTEYLAPKPVKHPDRPTIVTFNERPLDATYLILLALNEECRRMRRGCFYHLPLRQEISKGHPCDMVFIDEPWGEKSVKAWDGSLWDERLGMCAAEGRIGPHEHVIPVCCRILKFDFPGPVHASGLAHIYASNSDPAIAKHPNISTWSRPLVDASRILVVYMHHHASPIISHLNAVEHDSQCTNFPTPNDLSLTFVPNWLQTTSTVFGRKSNCDAPMTSASAGLAVKLTNAEVVLALLYIWNHGPVPIHHNDHKLEVFDYWETNFGSTKVLWQEMEDRIQNHNLDAQREMLKFWPKD